MPDDGRHEIRMLREQPPRVAVPVVRDAVAVGPGRPIARLHEAIPVHTSEAAYLAAVREPGPWFDAATEVCRREGLGLLARLARLEHLSSDSTFAVVGIPPDHVVKFYGHWSNGPSRLYKELRALRAMAQDPSLGAPSLVAHGSLGEGWQYLVMTRVAGVPLSDVIDVLEPQARCDIARWVGDYVRRMWELQLPAAEREDGWSRFSELATDRRERVVERLTVAAALPQHLLSEVDAWMPSAKELLEDPSAARLLHGALRPDHVLGDYEDGRFRPRAIIDFNSSHVGDPLYELGKAWWLMLECDREQTMAFLEGVRLQRRHGADFARRALAWALMDVKLHRPQCPAWGSVRTLDELAERCFGHATAGVPVIAPPSVTR